MLSILQLTQLLSTRFQVYADCHLLLLINFRHFPSVAFACAGNDSPTNGSYAVVGNSGMIAIHSILFANGEILFFGRPTEPYGDPAGPKIDYLTVSTTSCCLAHCARHSGSCQMAMPRRPKPLHLPTLTLRCLLPPCRLSCWFWSCLIVETHPCTCFNANTYQA